MSARSHSKLMDNIEDRLFRYRAKRLRFLINGDKHFNGINYALNTEKIRSFDALLNELTRSLSVDHLKLCKGVRYIFSQEGVLVESLSDFQDGQSYMCSSIDTFVPADYKITNGTLNWLVRNSACISSSARIANKKHNLASPAAQHQHRSQVNNRISSSHNASIESSFTNGDSHTPDHRGSTNNNQNVVTSRFVMRTPVQQRRNQISTKQHQSQKNHINTSQNDKNITSNNNSPRPQHKGTVRSDAQAKSPSQKNQLEKKPLCSRPQEKSTDIFGDEVLDRYDVGRPIGDGHFSVVYCCFNKSSKELCALKLIDKDKCNGREDMIYNEVNILKRLSHPNIVKLIEEFDYPKNLYLILELVQDGDLFDAISTVTKFSEHDVATMIHNLSSALTYLHQHNIVHRDIKPENLLISVQEDGSQSLKLADFGLAIELDDSPLYNVCGTAFYVSPEMLNEAGYDYKVDVWSTGVICYILLCGYPPFTSENEDNQDELFDAILAGDFEFAPSHWSKISQHAKNLIKCMLTVDPEKRYTAEQVFRHPWTMGTSSNFSQPNHNPMNISRRIAMQMHQR